MNSDRQEESYENWTAILHVLPAGVQTAVGKLMEECNITMQKSKELVVLKCF